MINYSTLIRFPFLQASSIDLNEGGVSNTNANPRKRNLRNIIDKHISMERRKGRDLSDAYYSRSKYLLQKAKEIEMITDCIVNLTITPTWEGVQRDMNQSHIHCNHYLTLQRLTHQQMR